MASVSCSLRVGIGKGFRRLEPAGTREPTWDCVRLTMTGPRPPYGKSHSTRVAADTCPNCSKSAARTVAPAAQRSIARPVFTDSTRAQVNSAWLESPLSARHATRAPPVAFASGAQTRVRPELRIDLVATRVL